MRVCHARRVTGLLLGLGLGLVAAGPAQSTPQAMSMPGMTMPARPAKAPAPAPSAPAAASDPVRPAATPPVRAPNHHLAPALPSHPAPMPAGAAQGMAMGDTPWLGMLLANELEWIGTPQGPQAAWDVEGWAGTPTRKLWVESEGSQSRREGSSARTELLFDQAMSRFWDWRVGYRQDAGAGPGRSWLAAGIQGLAPYWFELEAMAYVSPQGRMALRVEARYDLLLTQRLILSPKFETQIYSRADPRRELGGGLSDASLGLRLRYEITRKFAPYVGVGWDQRFGATAAWAGRERVQVKGLEWMLGLRLWF